MYEETEIKVHFMGTSEQSTLLWVVVHGAVKSAAISILDFRAINGFEELFH